MREFFNTSRTGAVRVWRISVEGDAVHTEFGQLGGKMQAVTDYGSVKNLGRSNEISAEVDAQNLAERMILQKTRKGYSEGQEPEEDQWLDPFEGVLPQNLSFYKPKNSMSAKMDRMLEEGTAWALRKYDGEMMVIVKGLNGGVDIYSRRMLMSHHLEEIPWRIRFDHIAAEVEANRRIPSGTILLGEIVGPDPEEDNRWAVAQVLKSRTTKALRLQADHGCLHYVVWDIAWWNGQKFLSDVSVGERLSILGASLDGRNTYLHTPLCFFEYEGKEGLVEIAARCGWEGFVVIDPAATYGDRAFNLRGKPDRPAGCCKLKPTFEDDFVAFWDPEDETGSYGRGKNTGKLGSVELYQYDSYGTLVYICDMGNGWTKEFIEANSSPDCWPKVVQVKYESRTYMMKGDKTNALQFPRFVLEREDKAAEECINPEL